MIEKDLYNTLKNVCERVYPVKMPQGVVYPAITYFVVSDIPEQSLYGNIFDNSTRLQIDIWTKSYEEGKDLKVAVVEKIIELKGSNMSSQDFFEDDIEVYRQIIDFIIRR